MKRFLLLIVLTPLVFGQIPTNSSSGGGGGGGGTTYTFVESRVFQGAVCQSTTASTPFNLEAANTGIPACATGTNTSTGTLHFIAGSASYVQQHIPLPKNFTGNIDVGIKWRTVSTTGDVSWGITGVVVTDTMIMDQAFGANVTVTGTAPAPSLTLLTFNITALTITNLAVGTTLPGTCTVGTTYLKTDTTQWYACLTTDTWTTAGAAELFFKFYRVGTGGDTATGDAELFQLILKTSVTGPAVY